MVRHDLAEVRLWGRRVGALAEHTNGYCVFEYAPEWIAMDVGVNKAFSNYINSKFCFL